MLVVFTILSLQVIYTIANSSAFPLPFADEDQYRKLGDDDFIFNNCNKVQCNKAIQDLNRDEAKSMIDAIFINEFSDILYEFTGLKSKVESLVQYGVRIYKICAKCADFNVEQSCYQDFCGPSAYGHEATLSGMLFVPLRNNSKGEAMILDGVMKGAIWSHTTESKTCEIPSETWSTFDQGLKINLISPFLAATSGSVALAPDNLGYGESYDHHIGYIIRRAYKTGAVPLWLKAQDIISIETDCNSELGDSVVLGGYSEGGYGAVSIAEALNECMDVEVIMLHSAGSPLQISGKGGMEMIGNINTQLFPPSRMYYLVLYGTGYSAHYPKPTMLADAWQFDESTLRTSFQVMSLTTEGNSGTSMNNFIPQYPNDPLVIMNQDFVNDILGLIDENAFDYCVDPTVTEKEITEITDLLCPFLVENDFSNYLLNVSYPFEICHSPTDEVVPVSNAIPLFSDNFIEASGSHDNAATFCTTRFLDFFITEEFKATPARKSKSNKLCHQATPSIARTSLPTMDSISGIPTIAPKPSSIDPTNRPAMDSTPVKDTSTESNSPSIMPSAAILLFSAISSVSLSSDLIDVFSLL